MERWFYVCTKKLTGAVIVNDNDVVIDSALCFRRNIGKNFFDMISFLEGRGYLITYIEI